MERLPAYIPVVFTITTFLTVGIFLSAVRVTGGKSVFGRVVLFSIPFWLVFQYVLASGGFFQNTASIPPRLLFFAVGPAVILIFAAFLVARKEFIAALPITILTALHIIRIPIEFTLSWLAEASFVPEIMTFHGTNFDIISGVTAPLAFYFAYRNNDASRYVLIGWNLIALFLVLNVMITAMFCIPSPIQKLAFDQPNIAVLYAPYIWLPAVVVPIVVFAHIASLYQLFRQTDKT